MFGGLNSRLKGGLTRLQQIAAATVLTLKGPPETDVLIQAGDMPPTPSVGTVGRSITLKGGAASPLSIYPTQRTTAGDANLYAGDANVYTAANSGLTYGQGGAVNIKGGASALYAGNGGAVNITGGAAGTSSSGYGVGGAVVIAGGAGGYNSDTGGKVTIQAGACRLYNGSGADVEIIASDSGGSGATGGNVIIQGGRSLGTTLAPGQIRLDANRGTIVPTNATGGTIQFPLTNGVPTGVPTTGTNLVSMIPDTTNYKLWFYIGSKWRSIELSGVLLTKSADYTLVMADANRTVLHPSTDANARTFTIPANASVAYDVGTELTFVNDSASAVSIAITTDTLVLAGSGATGTRTLAQYGVCTAVKVEATKWYVSGTNIT